MKITRNVCPRNCFGTCSILSYVEDDQLLKITGDPKHGFTGGHLCAKGYAYTQYVDNPLRLKYPMIQASRGSGNWKRISWDEAYTIIAEKMVELYRRYGSNLASGFNKFSGNLGLLHYAVEGMFNSIGPHTKTYGDLCLATGEAAIRDAFGDFISPIPENMANAKMIVIWGANPAVTNIHQMKFIYNARKNGGKLVVIDPIYTETAAKADLFVQINPGTDALLALGIAEIILEKGMADLSFVENQAGFREYKELLSNTQISEICKHTGVRLEVMEELADLYGNLKPVATWSGFGLQRNEFGGQSIKAISSLAAISGNLKYGGVYYAHGDISDFPMNLLNFPEKKHPTIKDSRRVNISNFAVESNRLKDPPLKLLWIASRNPLAQDHNMKAWKELISSLELIITVDLFMTETAKLSDIVLPAASHFEEEDLNVSYWHHWLAMNEKTLPPFYEAKSDLKIAGELTQRLNEISPQFSTFPSKLEPLDWIEKELNEKVRDLYGIKSYKDLLEGPKPRRDERKQEGFFSFINSNDVKRIYDDSEWRKQKKHSYPFRLLSPQSLLQIHSQFSNLPWLQSTVDEGEETIVEINENIAASSGISNNMKVKIYNENGSVIAKTKTNPQLPSDCLLVKQTGVNSINQLIGIHAEMDMAPTTIYFYDSFVAISKL